MKMKIQMTALIGVVMMMMNPRLMMIYPLEASDN